MLFADLRLDEETFASLQQEKLLSLTKLYHSQNVKLLARLVEKGVAIR